MWGYLSLCHVRTPLSQDARLPPSLPEGSRQYSAGRHSVPRTRHTLEPLASQLEPLAWHWSHWPGRYVSRLSITLAALHALQLSTASRSSAGRAGGHSGAVFHFMRRPNQIYYALTKFSMLSQIRQYRADSSVARSTVLSGPSC